MPNRTTKDAYVSVFALAPQLLLIELGRQLCEVVCAAVYQRHREPRTGSGRTVVRRLNEDTHRYVITRISLDFDL